jgi:hypothetical protein
MSDDLTPDPRFAVGDRVTLSDNPDDPDLEGEAGEIKAMRYSQPKIAGFGPPQWKYSLAFDFDEGARDDEELDEFGESALEPE